MTIPSAIVAERPPINVSILVRNIHSPMTSEGTPEVGMHGVVCDHLVRNTGSSETPLKPRFERLAGSGRVDPAL